MTIHLISTCSEPMLDDEFVRPISRIVEDRSGNDGRTHEISVHQALNVPYDDLAIDDNLIICGTAFQDDEYLNHIDAFRWLRDTPATVLGICSGMQILALAWGAELSSGQEIGMVEVEILRTNPLVEGHFQAYALHKHSLKGLDAFEIWAKSEDCVQVIAHKRKDQYGVLFHPEVRQHEVIRRFIDIERTGTGSRFS